MSIFILYKLYLLGFVGSFVVQSFLQKRFGLGSAWGINRGWQTEIAIWNIGLSIVLYALIREQFVSSITVIGLLFLSVCFGINHLLAYLKAGRRSSNLAGFLANAAGVIAILAWLMNSN